MSNRKPTFEDILGEDDEVPPLPTAAPAATSAASKKKRKAVAAAAVKPAEQTTEKPTEQPTKGEEKKKKQKKTSKTDTPKFEAPSGSGGSSNSSSSSDTKEPSPTTTTTTTTTTTRTTKAKATKQDKDKTEGRKHTKWTGLTIGALSDEEKGVVATTIALQEPLHQFFVTCGRHPLIIENIILYQQRDLPHLFAGIPIKPRITNSHTDNCFIALRGKHVSVLVHTCPSSEASIIGILATEFRTDPAIIREVLGELQESEPLVTEGATELARAVPTFDDVFALGRNSITLYKWDATDSIVYLLTSSSKEQAVSEAKANGLPESLTTTVVDLLFDKAVVKPSSTPFRFNRKTGQITWMGERAQSSFTELAKGQIGYCNLDGVAPIWFIRKDNFSQWAPFYNADDEFQHSVESAAGTAKPDRVLNQLFPDATFENNCVGFGENRPLSMGEVKKQFLAGSLYTGM